MTFDIHSAPSFRPGRVRPRPHFEIKAGRAGRFEGYASLFESRDLNGDVVAPGAFTASLARRGTTGVKLLFQHVAQDPLGLWERIEEDARGLFCAGALLLETARAREVWALMRAGVVDGLSIGFETRRSVRDRRTVGDRRTVRDRRRPNAGPAPVRRLLEIDLWEISIVTFPMAPEARVTRLVETDDAPSAPPEPARGDAARALREAARALAHFE